jgi:hypothetical protein
MGTEIIISHRSVVILVGTFTVFTSNSGHLPLIDCQAERTALKSCANNTNPVFELQNDTNTECGNEKS